MIKTLYQDYFQKSKTFLFPALKIARNSSIQVSETFISWEGMYTPEDCKLLLLYDDVNTEAFQAFELKVLIAHPLYFTKHQILGTDAAVYVYDYSILKKDWAYFLQGRYSRLSKELKQAILTYYGKNSHEYKYIASYLLPEDFFPVYAELLDIHVDLLTKVGELCDPYNLNKETCKISVELLVSSAKFV